MDARSTWHKAGGFLSVLLLAVTFACSPGQTEHPADIPAELPTGDVLSDGSGEAVDATMDGEGAEVSAVCPEGYEPCIVCEADPDCEGAFDDLGPCEKALCHPDHHVCARGPVDEGTPCGDSDPCNGLETCRPEGEDGLMVCTPGEPPLCDDGDLCNGTESCQPDEGCVAGTPLGCDDGDACNGTETCSPGEGCQAGQPLECDDGEPCNGLETCDPEEGCQAGAPLQCDDDNACNGTESCVEGEGCQPGTPLTCDDNDPCNGTETCAPDEGCLPGTPPICDDGNACNGTESCDSQLGCLLGKPLQCDDNDLCNGQEQCDPVEGCISGTPAECDDGDPCTDDSCLPLSGCVHVPNENAGCCAVDSDCDDANPCTADSCAPDTGTCVHEHQDGACEDGDPCTTNDSCIEKACVPGDLLANCSVLCTLSGAPGETITCDARLARKTQEDSAATTLSMAVHFGNADLVAVVDRVCLEPGECSSVNVALQGGSLFDSGHTVYFAPSSPDSWSEQVEVSLLNLMDPSVPISGAFFDAEEKLVGDAHLLGFQFTLSEQVEATTPIPVVLHTISASNAAGDSLAIAHFAGTIVTANEPCGESLVHCFDGNPCTADACAPAQGSCSYAPQDGSCDDGNACTLGDYCDPVGDCVPLVAAPEGTDCHGQNLCTEVGTCNAFGECLFDDQMAVACPPTPVSCASNQCLPDTGTCQLVPHAAGTACNDGAACTTEDECDGMGGCSGVPVDCDDQVACTVDSCAPDSGECTNSPDGGLCDDANPCTEEMCDPLAGCVNTALDGGDCDDQDPCTSSDTCDQGFCAGTWDPAACGCNSQADCDELDDGNPCNGEYVCVDSACVLAPNSVVECPPYAGDCTFWECNPQTGQCEAGFAPEGTECDGEECLVAPSCSADGACVGSEVDCDDGDDCTVDSCVPGQGCTHEMLPECTTTLCICEVSGAPGETVACPFLLVRETEATSSPVGADFTLAWDDAVLDLVGFQDEVCMGSLCLPKTIPTCQPDGTGCIWGSLYPSGHSIVAAPKQLADWTNQGKLLFFHPSDPFKQLSEATFDQGEVVGDATYLTATFELQQEIPAEDPVCLWMAQPHFSLANGLPMKVKLQETELGRALVVY